VCQETNLRPVRCRPCTSPNQLEALALSTRLPHQPAPRPHFAVPGKRPGDFHTASSHSLRQPPPNPSVNNRRDGARTLRNCGRPQQRSGTLILSLSSKLPGHLKVFKSLFVRSVTLRSQSGQVIYEETIGITKQGNIMSNRWIGKKPDSLGEKKEDTVEIFWDSEFDTISTRHLRKSYHLTRRRIEDRQTRNISRDLRPVVAAMHNPWNNNTDFHVP
jgi:hypothetical protein